MTCSEKCLLWMGELIFDRKHMETLWLVASWTGIGSCHELPFHHDVKYRIKTWYVSIDLFYLFLIIWHLSWCLQEGQWHVHVASRGPWVFLLVVCDLCWTCRQAKLRRGVTWTEISISSTLWHDFFMCILYIRKSISQAKKFSLPNRTMNFRINVTYRNLYRVNFNFGHHPILGCCGSHHCHPWLSIHSPPSKIDSSNILGFQPPHSGVALGRSTRRSAGNEDRNELNMIEHIT